MKNLPKTLRRLTPLEQQESKDAVEKIYMDQINERYDFATKYQDKLYECRKRIKRSFSDDEIITLPPHFIDFLACVYCINEDTIDKMMEVLGSYREFWNIK